MRVVLLALLLLTVIAPAAAAFHEEDSTIPWLTERLATLGISASVVTALVATLGIGVFKELREHVSAEDPSTWAALVGRMASEISRLAFEGRGDEEEMVDELHTLLDPWTTEPLEPGGSSKRAKCTSTSDKLPRTSCLCRDPWVLKQPMAVRAFIKGVRREQRGSDRHVKVTCICGHEVWQQHLSTHVMQASHRDQLFELNGESIAHLQALAEDQRAQVAAYAALAQEASHELARLRAALERMQPEALETTLRATDERCVELQARLADAEAKLQRETWDKTYFECYARRNKQLAESLAARQRLIPTDPVAILNQELADAGAFASGVGATLHTLHRETLERIKSPTLACGGGGTHLSPSSRALMVFTYNTSRHSCYRVHAALHKWARIDYVSKLHRSVFAGVGTDRRYAESNAKFYKSIGAHPSKMVFGLAYDAAKMLQKASWDHDTNGLVGNVDFDSQLHFNSYEDLQTFAHDKVLAGYAQAFLICPLDAAVPSAFRIAGLIPTDLKFTQRDLHRWIREIVDNHRAEGFELLLTRVADNAAVHGREAILTMSPGAFASEREHEPGLGEELSDILTLFAYREKGAVCETLATLDITHGIKNWSLQPFSMVRCLMLGRYPVLVMHLVACQLTHRESGLFACDVNGSDRMDFGAAARRLNCAVRTALGSMSGTLGTIAYLYFGACTSAAYLDRDSEVLPLERCRNALRNLVFLRFWSGWLDATVTPRQHHFISAQTHRAFVSKDTIMLLLFLVWPLRCPDAPFTPWLVASEQVEKLWSELRAFILNKPDWSLGELLVLIKRWTYQNDLFADPKVTLPPNVSNRNHNRALFVREKSEAYVQTDWGAPTHEGRVALLRKIYMEVVAEVQPIMSALGMEEALRADGTWDAPPLEQWEYIEKLISEEEERSDDEIEQEQLAAMAAEHEAESEAEEGGGGGGDGGNDGGNGGGSGGVGAQCDIKYLVKHIVTCRTRRGHERELYVEWRGYPGEDTWELQSKLYTDVPEMVRAFFEGRRLNNPPWEAEEEGESEDEEEAEAEGEGGEAEGEDGAEGEGEEQGEPEGQRDAEMGPPPSDEEKAALKSQLAQAIGSEKGNLHVREYQLKEGASAAQVAEYELTHLLNPITHQMEHKLTMLSNFEHQERDDEIVLQGHTAGYMHRTKMSIRREDVVGDGYTYDGVYQIHIDVSTGAMPNTTQGYDLQLDADLCVGLVRVLEIRKAVGRSLQVRWSVRKQDASICMAVVLPFKAVASRSVRSTIFYEVDRASSPPQFVPLQSLGCAVELRRCAVDAAGSSQQYYELRRLEGAGGLPLQPMSLSPSMFSASKMGADAPCKHEGQAARR